MLSQAVNGKERRPILWQLILYGSLALGVSFLCSLLEAALLSVPPSYVALLVRRGSRTGRRLQKLKHNLDAPLSAILSLNTVAHTVGAAGVGSQAALLLGHWSVGIASGVMTLLILVCSEVIPKTLGAAHAKRLAGFTASATSAMVVGAYPLTRVLEWISRTVRRGSQMHSVERDELAAALMLGRQAGELDSEEYRILTNVLAWKRRLVRDVLTPRTVVFSLVEDASVGDVLAGNESLPYARIPIYRGWPEEITGYVTRTDIYREYAEGRAQKKLLDLARPIQAVPELATVRDALAMMLVRGEHSLLAVDEYGGFEGIVTLEDVVETLLGVEITDETDEVTDLRAFARHLADSAAERPNASK